MRIGSHHSLETREKLRLASLGQKASPETRAKMSLIHRGNKYSLGRKATPETRAKLSRVHLGRKHSEESKEKMRQAKLGKRHRPEAILKMRQAAQKRIGPKNSNWKGGGRRLSGGYVLVSLPEGGREREHRLVMEKILDRKLQSNEIVHHINGNTQDNRPENLQVMINGEHSKHHCQDPGRKKRVSKYLGQLCLVPSCDLPVRSLGWCNPHYQRFHRYGDPTIGSSYRRRSRG